MRICVRISAFVRTAAMLMAWFDADADALRRRDLLITRSVQHAISLPGMHIHAYVRPHLRICTHGGNSYGLVLHQCVVLPRNKQPPAYPVGTQAPPRRPRRARVPGARVQHGR